MKKNLNIGIGFVTGRSNVCNIINNYYSYIKNQMNCFSNYNVNIVFYILYDEFYQGTPKEEFYQIKDEVFKAKGIKIRYITPEDIIKEKEKAKKKFKLNNEEVNLIFGNGHAKGRNSLMYFAYNEKMDYLLFWDDDEYPVACVKDSENQVKWVMQNNVAKHIETMMHDNADITIGYHCGYISPIPYMELNDNEEEVISNYIDVIGNELVNWNSIKKIFAENNGVTYANIDLVNGNGKIELKSEDGIRFVAGSTLCINLKHIDKIPAFYNPPQARGEDTFFSMKIDENAKVVRVPCYHFHDGFLKYTSIMKNEFPNELKLIKASENDNIQKRFFKACLGWIKYKPLYTYLLHPDTYREKMDEYKKKMNQCIERINELFVNYDFHKVKDNLEEYDKNVMEHFKQFEKTNLVWDRLKGINKKC